MQKLRLLHIINNLNTGGAETLVSDLAKHQKDKYSVAILTLTDIDSPIKRRLINEGISVLTLNAHRFSPFNIIRIRKILKQYDIVHVHLFPSFYWAAFATVGLNKRPKLVNTIHSSYTRRNILIFRILDKYIYGKYDVITTISDSTRKIILEKYPFLSNKLITIPNGADIQNIIDAQPLKRSDIEIAEDNILIVQVANFRPQKDQSTLIKAISLLPENVVVAFAGSGSTMDENISLAKKLNVYSRCRFLGRYDNVPALLKAADIVVMSSKWEGFGLAALEGMAANKPVIATDVEGLYSIVNGAGLTFPVGDCHQLAEIISNVCTNTPEYTRLKKLCFQRAKVYDIRRIIPLYDNIYIRQ